MPAMIRWWEVLRTPEVAKWKYTKIALSGMPRMDAMEEFSEQCGEFCWRWRGKEDQGAVALVLDSAKAFERVSLPVVWGLGNTH